MTLPNIGQPLNRVDGRLKVTGAAKYSAEYPIEGLVHAVLLGSTISRGRIININTSAAEQAPGVITVLTHVNLQKLPVQPKWTASDTAMIGQSFAPMQGTEIHYGGQPVAMVIADMLEHATHAARLVEVNYQSEAPLTFHNNRRQATEATAIWGGIPGRTIRGDVVQGLAQAEVQINTTCTLAGNHHNPMEPSATIAHWQDDNLTLYDSAQGTSRFQGGMAQLLNLPLDNVRVIAKFVGGGFGCKTMVWPHIWLTALAARQIDRPVKLVLTREQMYTSVGYREEQVINLTLGATREGKLTAIRTSKTAPRSLFDEAIEPHGIVMNKFYRCPNFEVSYQLVPSNVMTGIWMRGPGEVPGMYVLETAMDELAYQLKLDPIELRLRNYAETDPDGKPWSSKSLKQCYEQGAELFGWAERNPQPGAMREGRYLIGYGMASSTYPVNRPGNAQSAHARLQADGRAVIQCSGVDIGTGMYTILAQVGADPLGLSPDRVQVEIGDSALPGVAIAGGSQGAACASNAVHAAATNLRQQLVELAVADSQSPLYQANPDDIGVENGQLLLQSDRDRRESYSALLTRQQRPAIEATGSWQYDPAIAERYAMDSFGAIFVKVRVDPDLGLIRVAKMTGVYAAGRILNQKTARSQILGGMVWGVSKALLEHTHTDDNFGRYTNANYAEYLVPVHADIPTDITIEFLEERDPHVNVLGVKAVGELGGVGVDAAIANAIFHATGKRIRDLPITSERLL